MLSLSPGAALDVAALSRVLQPLAGALSLGAQETRALRLGETLLLQWPGERLCADHIAAATAPFLCADSGAALASHKQLLAGPYRRMELVLRRGEAAEGRVPVLLEVVIHSLLPSQATSEIIIAPSAVCVGELTSSLREAASLSAFPFRLEWALIPLSPLTHRWLSSAFSRW